MIAVSVPEGQFFTPHVVGRRLKINPAAVFIMLVIDGWLWGIVGIVMAVPFLVSFKIMCEEIPALAPITEFLTAYSSRSQRLSDIES